MIRHHRHHCTYRKFKKAALVQSNPGTLAALFLCLLILAGLLPALTAAAEEEKKLPETAKLVQSQAKELESEVSQGPDASQGPKDTQGPDASQGSEDTQGPDAPQSPGDAQKPDASQSPEDTQGPESSQSPEDAQEPEASPDPEDAPTPKGPPGLEETQDTEEKESTEEADGPEKAPDEEEISDLKDGSLSKDSSVHAGRLLAPLVGKTDGGVMFSDLAEFQSIELYDTGGEPIIDNALLEKDKPLILRYTCDFSEQQCRDAAADTSYYLSVSPHLVLPHLKDGSPLMVTTDDGEEQFGTIYADGSSAWVTFTEDGAGTVLSKYASYGGIEGVYFYLECTRAAEPPEDEPTIDGNDNLYAMKFENGGQLKFGYAENEPVWAKALLEKDGILADNTITWNIDYTPWQNPSADDAVTMDSAFEVRDRIVGSLHSYVDDSAKIDGTAVAVYESRDEIQEKSPLEAYLLIEEDGEDTVLTFGGTRLGAGRATKGSPAQKLEITYQTSVNKELLLPGKDKDTWVTNAAGLFAGKDKVFNELNIKAQKPVKIPQPTWVTKSGETKRHTDGTGSETVWTVEFYPNGFTFDESCGLTLHDRIPDGSELVEGSVKVGGKEVSVAVDDINVFTVSKLTAADAGPIKITYRTKVPEKMYDDGEDLGSNVAWFTFRYNDTDYSTPEAVTPVGSGDGSGTSGTARLVKTTKEKWKYDPASRTIEWTVKINPHSAYLKGGTFEDDLKIQAVGGVCNNSAHSSGLELVGDIRDISVLVDGKALSKDDRKPISLEYKNRILTITVGEIGAKTITLDYTTKVCDPCIFANNTKQVRFTNEISTDNMLIGSEAVTGRSDSAESTAEVGATVLTKQAPVYDYDTGMMRWTIEVDEAGLSMTDVVLEDKLPDGLTYKTDSLTTNPAIPDANASVSGRELTVSLGTVTEKTTVAFDTAVDPEILGFGGGEPVKVENTVRMNGSADGVRFTEVSHRVEHSFTNHGLVKSNHVDSRKELIEYEVLINPFKLSLPENPEIIDTLDRRLQLDTDTLRFYSAKVSGTTGSEGQKPVYEKTGDGQSLSVTGYDPASNSFTVQLPIPKDSKDAYVLTYTADIIDCQNGGYDNSVRFDGGDVLLGGNKNDSATVSGGGGGGGGGVAARKAGITITMTDEDGKNPLAGVTFTLYQWDSDKNMRGLPFAQGKTDAQGRLSFKVKPGAVYELVETESIPGYSGRLQWEQLPPGVTKTDTGLLLTMGAAKSELKLELTNETYTPITPPDGSGNTGTSDGTGGSGSILSPGASDSSAGSADLSESYSFTGQVGSESSLSLAAAGLGYGSSSGAAVPYTSDEQSSDNGSGFQDVPRTGDSTPLMLAIVFLSGTVLAVMTLYQLLRKINRNKLFQYFYILLLPVFLLSGTALAVRSVQLHHGGRFYEQAGEEGKNNLSIESGIQRGQETERPELSEKLAQFAGVYPEAAAWLQIPGTSADYPVMSGTDNRFYLDHLPDGRKNAMGSLFLDYRTAVDSPHLIIYGHNIMGGKMFGLLKQYESPDYFMEHKTLTVATEDSVYVCPVFSVRRVEAKDDAYRLDFKDKDALTEYAMQAASQSLYPTDVNLSNIRSIVTLSTCTVHSSQRLIVQAVLPSEQEAQAILYQEK